ncbi:MAG TPA: glycosyltransferase family 2 protein [Thermoanaerobaculia bacterium]
MQRLTIAIPTYDRNDVLLRSLEPLLPQLTRDCTLLIVDNKSPRPVRDTVEPLLARHPHVDWKIVRNVANLGLVGNILRCFELCRTEWLWVLSDDDTVRPDAIRIINEEIDKQSDAVVFHFSSQLYARDKTIVTRGTADFVERLDEFWHTLFVSTSVYHAPAVVPYLRLGLNHANSLASHFVLVLAALKENGVCCLSERQIVDWNEPAKNQEWSRIVLGLGVMTVLDMDMPSAVRRPLARKMLDSIPHIRVFVLQLLLLSVRTGDTESSLYLYDQMCSRLYYYERRPAHRMARWVYRMMLRFPRLSYRTLNAYKTARGTSLKTQISPDAGSRT